MPEGRAEYLLPKLLGLATVLQRKMQTSKASSVSSTHLSKSSSQLSLHCKASSSKHFSEHPKCSARILAAHSCCCSKHALLQRLCATPQRLLHSSASLAHASTPEARSSSQRSVHVGCLDVNEATYNIGCNDKKAYIKVTRIEERDERRFDKMN